MAIFTNQSKTQISPLNSKKAGVYLWGDSSATWGDILASWGGNSPMFTNLGKSTGTSGLWTSQVLVWQLPSPWTYTQGAIAWTNQTKN